MREPGVAASGWPPAALTDVRVASVPRRLRLLEPVVCLALAAHAGVVHLVEADRLVTLTSAAVVVVAAIGLAGLAGWRGTRAATVRLAVVLVVAFVVAGSGTEGGGYFVLWFFAVASVYPLVLPHGTGRLVPFAVPLVYLALLPLGAADGPWQIAVLRAVALCLIGVFVHTAASAYRHALSGRDGALALLELYVSATPVGMAFWDASLQLRRANAAMEEAGLLDVEPAVAVNLHRVVTTGSAVRDVELARGERVWTASFYPVRLGSRLLGVGGVLVEVTDERAAAEALVHSATHDSLTGLPNRTLFADRVEVALAQAQRTDGAIAVLFCDVDRFKDVNDSLGHAAGDALLRTVGERLAGLVRDGDTVARLGGDEFGLLCTDVEGPAAALLIAERVCAAMREPVRLPGQVVTATMSIGVAVHRCSDGGDHDVAALLRDADVAMYQAKDAGRDQVARFDPSRSSSAGERLEFHGALRRAVEDGGIGVHYQPVVALDGLGPPAFEALARWTRPGTGPVPPGVFIPAAEELGLIHVLGEQVLRTSCRTVRRWREDTGLDVSVAVNLSARQLASPAVVRLVADVLDQEGLPPDALQLEITESVLMGDVEQGLVRLAALRELGIRLAVDDFGTGYSSLAYLRDLPVDVLKIDRSFTSRLPGDEAMFRYIVQLARAIGATTVVEGVETAEQLTLVTAVGCDRAQGFHLGRPQPAEAAQELLRGLAARTG